MPTTFTKLRDGSWGLRGPGLVEGETVWVEKRGAARAIPVVVGKVLWTGDGLCVARKGSAPSKAKPACKPAPEPTPVTIDWTQAEAEDDASLNWEM